MTATVEVSSVSKWFRDLVAITEITFALEPGVTALLGPNGAGKSTLLRVLVGLTSPDQGTVRLFGADPRTDLAVRRRIGLVPQQETMFEHMRAVEQVALTATLHEVGDPLARAVEAVESVDLDPADARPISTYSKGMRQRVKVANAVVHDPEIVVLDEPLEGLDPRQRLRMIERFRQMGAAGKTVVVSSHVLDEVERFGERVLVLAQGRLAAEGDYHAIRDLMDDQPRRVRVRADQPRVLASHLMASGLALGVRRAEEEGEGALIVDTDDAAGFRRGVAAAARDSGVRLWEVVPLDDDLDSVFRYLVGRRR